jgi:DNA-binding MarR family transcriptional regulator
VRHPIYRGLLLAALGTGITIGEARCILGFALLILAFVAKVGQEERLMLEVFPQTYPAYRLRVKALIPGVFQNGMPNKISQPIAAQAERIDQDLAAIRRVLRRGLEIEEGRAALTMPQVAVMRVVVRQPGISLKELSLQLSLAHSTVSGIVDRLEKQGMLGRKPDPADGRANCIHPTQPVADFVRGILPELSRGPLRKALAAARSAERAVISQAVHRLRELLEEADAEA